MILFPFAEYWTFYLTFTTFVLFMLLLDLGVFHRHAHEVKFKEAATWTAIWILLALVFNWIFYRYAFWKFQTAPQYAGLPGFNPEIEASRVALEFLTGFIVEKSLAVDNIFVFVVVFTFFAVPAKYQHRVLFFGILGALFFRVIFIALGAILMQYHWVVVFFGVLLIATGIKLFFAPKKPLDPSKNPVVRLAKKIIPLTDDFSGQKFFVRINRKTFATPLFLALIFVEVSDIIFAVDSVPAIFALTKEPLIVFTSNIFAILGLRSMYFMLAGVVDRFHLLKYGLGIVLVFVGLKMVYLNEAFGGKFPISWSLAFIATVIGTSIALSLLIPVKQTTSKVN